ncbi:MAG: radical SAM protein [Deltaproteobacteria bacterium]|nr:radical SAM protein [Deltaproteobacteria bacterium]
MERNVIRKTTSISPETFNEIDAEVIYEDGKVYLEKKAESGTVYKGLIEKDLKYYQMQTAYQVKEQVRTRHLQLYVSSKCNLNCPLCYENELDKEELSFEEIEHIARESRNKHVVLMGREPTLRKDLIEIIRVLAKQNRPVLLTNGLKLTDYDYTSKLKEAGLEQIIFSFNGFDDEVYRVINGKPLLDTKLKALETIKKVGIRTIISITLAKGVNDKELREVCDYCIANRSFILQLRVRTATQMGRHLENVESHCMTDMIRLFADQLNVAYEDILKEQAFWSAFVDELDFIVPSNALSSLLKNRVCSFTFTVFKDRKDGRYTTFGSRINMEAISSSKFKKALVVYNLIKALGVRGVTQNFIRMLQLPIKLGEPNHLMIFVRYWPNIYNIDLEENKKCPSMYYIRNGEHLPFCYANILDTFKQQERLTG